MEIPKKVEDAVETVVTDVVANKGIAETLGDAIEEAYEAFVGKTPAHWNIQPTEDGITAHNSTTAEFFEGTLKEFNKRLRG